MTPDQCRAGRALVGMTQQQLGEKVGVSRKTIAFYETGVRAPMLNNLRMMRMALEAEGVEMIDGDRPGVRMAMGKAA